MKQPAREPQKKKPAAKRKTRDEINTEARDRKRDKKHRGNASGSRANPVTTEKKNGAGSSAKDPRIGSKKPVALGTTAVATQPVKKSVKVKPAEERKLSPEEELAMLENHERLDNLLDRLEKGESLKAEDQAWLDQTLDRIDQLMEQLGIALDDDVEDEEAEEDMYRLLKGGN